MELTIRRSLDGDLMIDCGDEHRCLAMWLEREINKSRQFPQQLQARLMALHELAELRLDSDEFRFIANRDEILISVSEDSLEQPSFLIDQPMNLDACYSACGFDDFIELLKAIAAY